MTHLTVPVTATTKEAVLKALDSLRHGTAEMIELRVDYLKKLSSELVEELVIAARRTNLPVIATCRTADEGGCFTGSDSDLIAILSAALSAGADYIDIEFERLIRPSHPGWPHFYRIAQDRVILSYHDFKTVPNDFDDRLQAINNQRPAVSKIVYHAKTINDCFKAMDALHERTVDQPPLIALAMGPAGMLSRLTTKKLNAFLTFASFDDNSASAPGQVTIDQVKNLYRWDVVGPNSSLFGVIGYPIAHSLSPDIHNAAFSDTVYNGLYLPLLVDPAQSEFDRFLQNILDRPWLGFRGLSVTLPHKQHALAFVQQADGQLEPLAKKIGAVNTIIIDSDGKLHGYNTDYAAALDAVADSLNISWQDFQAMPSAIIGAGGVARALAAGLADCKADVTIYNRTLEKAKRLADEFNCRYAGLDQLDSLDAKLLVNCTSIGMAPDTDASPVPQNVLNKDRVVFDTVYNPIETLLLRHARQAGCRTVDGAAMFVNQAVRQFELFTGQDAPQIAMDHLVRDRLAGES